MQAIEAFRRVRSGGTRAVLVAVYGNRAYEDALVELRDTVVQAGFVPVAAATFVGEHSFSGGAVPLAQGRPDEADIAKASAFGRMVRERLAYTGSVREAALLKVPGNIPYRERMTLPLKMLPGTADDLCTGCGVCLERCPRGRSTWRASDHDRQGRLHPLLRLREELSHRGEATGRSGVPGGSGESSAFCAATGRSRNSSSPAKFPPLERPQSAAFPGDSVRTAWYGAGEGRWPPRGRNPRHLR